MVNMVISISCAKAAAMGHVAAQAITGQESGEAGQKHQSSGAAHPDDDVVRVDRPRS